MRRDEMRSFSSRGSNRRWLVMYVCMRACLPPGSIYMNICTSRWMESVHLIYTNQDKVVRIYPGFSSSHFRHLLNIHKNRTRCAHRVTLWFGFEQNKNTKQMWIVRMHRLFRLDDDDNNNNSRCRHYRHLHGRRSVFAVRTCALDICVSHCKKTEVIN